MKTTITVLIALIASLSFTSCSDNPQSSPEKAVKMFLTAAINEDYSTAVDCIDPNQVSNFELKQMMTEGIKANQSALAKQFSKYEVGKTDKKGDFAAVVTLITTDKKDRKGEETFNTVLKDKKWYVRIE